jgi:3-phenylpropionate/trans-cinnamate dioxygenase ferredoxin subunit
MSFNTIAKTSDFESKAIKTVMIGDKPVIISKLDGKFYAVDAICTHMQGYLPAGKIENACITCPVHHAQYDLKSGKMVKNVLGLVKMATGSAVDLKSYELNVEDGDIKVRE